MRTGPLVTTMTLLLMSAWARSEPPAAPEPALICVSIGFDLRGMPHRGPYDVDPRAIESRRGYLYTQLRDATPEPKPEIRLPPTPTVFTARFAPSATQTAMARCTAAVAAVVPAPRLPLPRRRPDFRGPKVDQPCAPCPPEPVEPPVRPTPPESTDPAPGSVAPASR